MTKLNFSFGTDQRPPPPPPRKANLSWPNSTSVLVLTKDPPRCYSWLCLGREWSVLGTFHPPVNTLSPKILCITDSLLAETKIHPEDTSSFDLAYLTSHTPPHIPYFTYLTSHTYPTYQKVPSTQTSPCIPHLTYPTPTTKGPLYPNPTLHTSHRVPHLTYPTSHTSPHIPHPTHQRSPPPKNEIWVFPSSEFSNIRFNLTSHGFNLTSHTWK